jgi:hypothetical protein
MVSAKQAGVRAKQTMTARISHDLRSFFENIARESFVDGISQSINGARGVGEKYTLRYERPEKKAYKNQAQTTFSCFQGKKTRNELENDTMKNEILVWSFAALFLSCSGIEPTSPTGF